MPRPTPVTHVDLFHEELCIVNCKQGSGDDLMKVQTSWTSLLGFRAQWWCEYHLRNGKHETGGRMTPTAQTARPAISAVEEAWAWFKDRVGRVTP